MRRSIRHRWRRKLPRERLGAFTQPQLLSRHASTHFVEERDANYANVAIISFTRCAGGADN